MKSNLAMSHNFIVNLLCPSADRSIHTFLVVQLAPGIQIEANSVLSPMIMIYDDRGEEPYSISPIDKNFFYEDTKKVILGHKQLPSWPSESPSGWGRCHYRSKT